MSGEVFLTGATGFIGSSLLKKWLDASDARITLLVRARSQEIPEQRIQSVLGELYPDSDTSVLAQRIAIVEGDVALDMLGLSAPEYAGLTRKTSHVIHCAAAARFDLELAEARRINVSGTHNILSLARRCKDLKRIDHVSTAYVAGTRTGIIREDELDCGQQHNNTYEQTKLEAEKAVRQSMADLPAAIHRPSIVICDSKTGRGSGHDAFSRVLKGYALGRIKMLPARPSVLLDLVPADYVADAMHSICANTKSLGKCFHLTAGLSNLTSFEEIRNLAAHHFQREPLTLVTPEEFSANVSKSAGKVSADELDLVNEIRLYMPYLTGDLRFDNANTMRATGLEAPRVSDYFGRMVEYIIHRKCE
ncbi:MAG: SDR family oxidoreductase [Candidatus Eisenbacteria bacterium]